MSISDGALRENGGVKRIDLVSIDTGFADDLPWDDIVQDVSLSASSVIDGLERAVVPKQ